MSVMIVSSGTNVLKNNVVEERMAHYRTEEVAINMGVLSQYDDYGQIEMRFDREYEFTVESTAGTNNYNLTMEAVIGEPVRSEVRLPTDITTDTGTFTNDTLCVTKTDPSYVVPDRVEIDEGAC